MSKFKEKKFNNQSVENAGVAFVKGAVYYIGVSGVVASLLHQVTKLGVSLRQQNNIAVIDIFNEKRKSCNHPCPDSVYFHTLLLIIYLSAIERLICHIEMSLIGSSSFGFAQNTMHHFQNTIFHKCHKNRTITKLTFKDFAHIKNDDNDAKTMTKTSKNSLGF